MRIRHVLLGSALLGSMLGIAALPASAGANHAQLDWKRNMAVFGFHGSAENNMGRFASVHAPAKFRVLHNFAGGTSDGAGSTAEVTLDASGNIYGTTDYGGTSGYGTVFKLTADGTESLLYSFAGGPGDGATPDGAVTILANGDMIGTTSYGGSQENGTIWKLAADGTYSVLHNFATDEGNFIRGRLAQDKKGNLYGTGLFGGTNGDGTVFKFSPKGKLTVLHTFAGSDGEFPEHSVVRDKAGNLYGVTAFGGATDNGTVYKIAKDGTFTTLYSFTGGSDGGFPYGTVGVDKDGNVYGNADDGGANGYGTVFKIAPDGTFTTLYSFTGGADGANPEGNMLVAGTRLYSTTTSGGANSEGGVYELTGKGTLKVLANFSETNGNYYSAGLTKSGNTFYGTAEDGGTSENGTVFSVTRK